MYKYYKYRKYNLMLLPIIGVLFILSERKNDVYFFIAVLLFFFVITFGHWLEILKNKELELPIPGKIIRGFWFSLIVGVISSLILLMRLKI